MPVMQSPVARDGAAAERVFLSEEQVPKDSGGFSVLEIWGVMLFISRPYNWSACLRPLLPPQDDDHQARAQQRG